MHRLQKARKSFDIYLVILSKAASGRRGCAPLALAYARAEAERKAGGFAETALYVLTWLGSGSGPFHPVAEKQAALPPAERCAVALLYPLGFRVYQRLKDLRPHPKP